MEQPDLTLEYDPDSPMSDKGDSAEFRSLSKVEPILEFLLSTLVESRVSGAGAYSGAKRGTRSMSRKSGQCLPLL
ncbi:MAG: hypothetical protein R3C24_09560 [Cyanobacteriota/Melainabacteria group bacterium]